MYMVRVLEREMNTKQKQQQQLKRRLDRRNAIKNFDYDAWSPSWFETYRTQSVDVSPLSDNRTSFRIKGTDGELDRICSYLGLSGPEDFAIPAAAWETRKARLYHFPSSRLLSEGGSPDAFEGRITVSKCSRLKNGVDPAKSEARVREIGVVRHDDGELRVSVRGSGDGGCGIWGARPPLLAPQPAMPRSVTDNVSSTWDIFWSFGPQGDEDLGSPTAIRLARVLKEEEREIEEDEYGIDEQTVLWETCSDTSNDDKDEMAMELVYSVSPNGTFKRSIKNWQKGDFLGRGSFGTVHEGFTDAGFFFAVKEVSLLDQGSQGKQSIYQLEQEISLLRQFKHENIVQYLGTDKDDSNLYIFLELVTKGSLANLYQKYDLWDSQVSAYTRQILNGLNYLHGQNVVHRDIKCANILVDASGSVKLADFGLAKATKLNDLKSCKGTAYWMAPEVVNGKNHGYGLAADIWSLGCTVLEMLTRKIPYSHLEPMQALFRIGNGEPPLIPSSLSSEAQDFILKCLQVVPDDRPTAAQLLDHPFVKRPLSTILAPPSPFRNGTRA